MPRDKVDAVEAKYDLAATPLVASSGLPAAMISNAILRPPSIVRLLGSGCSVIPGRNKAARKRAHGRIVLCAYCRGVDGELTRIFVPSSAKICALMSRRRLLSSVSRTS